MKKLIFILLCILSFNSYSQINYSTHSMGVSISSEYAIRENNVEGVFTTYLQHRLLFYNDTYWRFSFNLIMFTLPNPEPNIRIGVGMESPILSSNFHIFGEVFPSIGVVGIGHQVYGDYFAFYLPLNVGIEYRLNLTEKHILSFEVSMEKDFTVYSSIPPQLRDDIYLRFKLNYSYKFFTDER